MPFFIFNHAGKQRADFYESQITDVEILWQGESVDAFIADTGFSIAQLGGFVLEGGTLTFDQALKDAHDAPQEAVKTPQDKLQILTAMVSELDDQKQADLLQGISGVYLALNAGNLNVAKLAVANIPTGNDPQLVAMKQAVLAILES